jgi:hypothetical protein
MGMLKDLRNSWKLEAQSKKLMMTLNFANHKVKIKA